MTLCKCIVTSIDYFHVEHPDHRILPAEYLAESHPPTARCPDACRLCTRSLKDIRPCIPGYGQGGLRMRSLFDRAASDTTDLPTLGASLYGLGHGNHPSLLHVRIPSLVTAIRQILPLWVGGSL